jgi:acyl-CoA synthetase (AMP-forming)/AMP-acid ligase II
VATPWQREVAILFTSGTSGPPKGCVLTNEYVMTAGAWYRDLGGALTLRPAQERLLNPLPVFVASLKDPLSRATLAALFAEAPPDMILNCTAFAVGIANIDA